MPTVRRCAKTVYKAAEKEVVWTMKFTAKLEQTSRGSALIIYFDGEPIGNVAPWGKGLRTDLIIRAYGMKDIACPMVKLSDITDEDIQKIGNRIINNRD
jgi:hypothetical protein